jgi:cytosine/adenosine deaminase-related metal-dependent hydrolase
MRTMRERPSTDAYPPALQAARAAVQAGTAALGDVGNGVLGWRVMEAAGLRGIFFHELVGSREQRTGDALADAAAERRALADTPRIPAVPAPHAPYSVGPALLERIFAAARATGHPTSIHLAEDPDEIALLASGGGGWPAVLRAMGVTPEERVPHAEPCAYLDRLGAFSTPPAPLLVHMVHASADDRRRARAAGATVVLCPRSNLHIGDRLPDVTALLADGVALAIGTDSLASAPDLSVWGELSVLAAHFPAVPARTWLAAATLGGARALGLPRLGALEVGRRPGLLAVPLPLDARDPERALVENPPPSSSIAWVAHA